MVTSTQEPVQSPGSPAPQSPVTPSSRLKKLPPYVFAQLDDLKEAARARGADLIDLGMGNPDLPTPGPIVKVIQDAVGKAENHRYPQFKGKPEFRQAVARFMERRYGVPIDPDTQVQALIGSKEGLAHLSFAYVAEGDVSLVPSPYYPVHGRATILAGGEAHYLPLSPENNFLPDLDSIPESIVKRAKLFFVNYPNNPTAAIAPLSFYEKLVAFCKKHSIVLVSDLAYGEICFDGYRPPSIFNVPGAMDIAVEFHSFSKSFNMAGWRVGFAVGNAGIIKTLYSMKTNLDYGVASAIQDGAVHALDNAETYLPEIINTYQSRRDVVIDGFRKLGWPVTETQATLYVWLPIPERFSDSMTFIKNVMDSTDVVFTPGVAFGDAGDRYFRVSLVSSVETLKAAIERLEAKGIRYQA